MKKIYGIRGRRRNRQCLCRDPGKRTGKGRLGAAGSVDERGRRRTEAFGICSKL